VVGWAATAAHPHLTQLNAPRARPITRVMSLEATVQRISAIRQELANPSALVGSSEVTGGTEAPATNATATGGESSFASALQRANAGYEVPGGEDSPATEAALLEDSNASSAADLGSAAGLTGYTGTAGTAAVSSTPSLSSYYQPQSLDGVAGSTSLSGIGASDQQSPGARIVAVAESQLGQTEQPPGSNESPAIAQYRTATAGAVPGAPWCAYFASWAAREAGEPIGVQGQGAGAVEDVWSWAQSTGRAIPNGPGVVPQPGDLIVFGDEHVGIVRDVLPNGQIQTIEGNYENKVAANVRSPTEATGYVNMS
jgi:CHAP domain-containing protein